MTTTPEKKVTLESLVPSWASVRNAPESHGFFENHQVCHSNFGDWNYLFGTPSLKMKKISPERQITISEWTRIPDHLAEHFGIRGMLSAEQQKAYDGNMFIELRKLKNERARILLYGDTSWEVGTSRTGTFYSYIEGNYAGVQKIFDDCKKYPSAINYFIRLFFDQNYKSDKSMARISPEYDVMARATTIHFLDVGEGYSWLQRRRIKNGRETPSVDTLSRRPDGRWQRQQSISTI